MQPSYYDGKILSVVMSKRPRGAVLSPVGAKRSGAAA